MCVSSHMVLYIVLFLIVQPTSFTKWGGGGQKGGDKNLNLLFSLKFNTAKITYVKI